MVGGGLSELKESLHCMNASDRLLSYFPSPARAAKAEERHKGAAPDGGNGPNPKLDDARAPLSWTGHVPAGKIKTCLCSNFDPFQSVGGKRRRLALRV